MSQNTFLKNIDCRLLVIGLIVFVIFSAFGISRVSASGNPTVYFSAPTSSITRHSLFSVDVMLDTAQPVNAVSIYVTYPSDRVSLRSIRTSDSLIDIWHNIQPVSNNSGTIEFEGGSTNPFSGSKGKVGEIVFEAETQGVVQLSFSKSDLYYANGLGTDIAAGNVPVRLSIVSQGTLGSSYLANAMTPPPDITDVKVVNNPIGGYPLAIFRVVDQGGGVQSAQIRFLNGLRWSYWQSAANSVPVPQTAWAFQVRAFDSSGNVSQRTMYLWDRLVIPGFILVMTIIIIFVGYPLYRRWRLRKTLV